MGNKEEQNKIEQYKKVLHNRNNQIIELYRALRVHQEYSKAVRNSLSAKLGFALTKPLRALYDMFIGVKTGANPLYAEIPDEKWLREHLDFKIEDRTDTEIADLDPELIKILTQSYGEPEKISVKQKVLFIAPNLPDFDTSSGGKRATRMLDLISEIYDVYVFTLGEKPLRHRQKLDEIGVMIVDTSDFDYFNTLIPRVDVIIYAWYSTYHDYPIFRKIYPEAKIILDSVDVHWVREERSLGKISGLTKTIVKSNKKREIEAYRAADVIWAVTENDKQAIHEEIPQAKVEVVSNIHSPRRESHVDCEYPNLAFIGGYRHPPNIGAVKKAALEIMPLIHDQVPEAKLIIAGSHAPQEIRELGNLEYVLFEGYLDEKELEEFYDNAIATINYLEVGAGIKGKICESISFATPVLTTDIGNEGINLIDGEEALISNNINDLAERAVRLLKGDFDLTEMTNKARTKLMSIVGPDVALESMIKSISPLVSVCIVTYNKLELLKPCIESILQHTRYPNYKILVHSNGCTDGSQEFLKEISQSHSNIIPILSKTNDVFVIPNNQMMDMYPESDVVLLNNDTVVSKDWLNALMHTAYSDSKIGIVGSKILYPDGVLQEFGSELYAEGGGRNIGKWEDPDQPEYNVEKMASYVSGCSMLIKRSTINKIGKFDEQFHPCYCEDSDYCYTAWENGIQTYVTPHSQIYHYEGGTSGTDTSSGFKKYQEINMKKFMSKHGDTIEKINDLVRENLSSQ